MIIGNADANNADANKADADHADAGAYEVNSPSPPHPQWEWRCSSEGGPTSSGTAKTADPWFHQDSK